MYIMDLQDSKKALLYVMEFFSGPMFNDWINKWGLLEISISNRGYTWSNNQDNPILVVLDRVFTSMD